MDKQQIKDIHQAEAKRLIEVFLGLKIFNAGSFYTKSEFEIKIYKAKKNALKCCKEIIRAKPLAKSLEYWKSVKQAIKDYKDE